MKKMGIYQIQNLVNGKVYIGSSINLDARRRNHFNDLKKNKHSNIKLQRAYNIHGQENFEFSVIEYVESINLLQIEQWHIDTCDAVNSGYNICKIAGNTLGKKHSKETKRKLKILRLFQVITDETKKKIGDSNRGDKSVWFGRKHLEESKLKMSIAQIAEKNHFFGKHHTQEAKNKIRLAVTKTHCIHGHELIEGNLYYTT
jgi:group I intron endonuclease